MARNTAHYRRLPMWREQAKNTFETACFPDYRPPYDYSNPFFASNLDDLIINSRADLWVFGHTHSSHDYKIGDTRMICNPRRYSNGDKTGFDSGLVVEI